MYAAGSNHALQTPAQAPKRHLAVVSFDCGARALWPPHTAQHNHTCVTMLQGWLTLLGVDACPSGVVPLAGSLRCWRCWHCWRCCCQGVQQLMHEYT